MDNLVRYSVADQGLGIPKREQNRIFEKFYRLDPDMTGGIGGTGLGLYISRELVRRVKGRIWVEPNEGHGSVFHVEIPTASDPGGQKLPEAGSCRRLERVWLTVFGPSWEGTRLWL